MDLTRILADLRHEREQIDEAVLSLERQAAGSGRTGKLLARWLRKASDDPDGGSGGTSGEGSAGLARPLLPRGRRRPPKVGRAGAALRLDAKLADAVGTHLMKRRRA